MYNVTVYCSDHQMSDIGCLSDLLSDNSIQSIQSVYVP